MKTDVIFRKWKNNEVIAIFPEIPFKQKNPSTCMSYQKIGQHGEYALACRDITKLATEQEYQSLKKELETIGYKFNVISKATRKHFNQRNTTF